MKSHLPVVQPCQVFFSTILSLGGGNSLPASPGWGENDTGESIWPTGKASTPVYYLKHEQELWSDSRHPLENFGGTMCIDSM